MSKAEHPYSKNMSGSMVIHSADEELSTDEEQVASDSTLSRLSSEHGMSPANEEATPTGSSLEEQSDEEQDQSQSTN